MPSTDPPDIADSFYQWTNGSSTENGMRKVDGRDTIQASDINEMRMLLVALANHTHGYTDTTGGC